MSGNRVDVSCAWDGRPLAALSPHCCRARCAPFTFLRLLGFPPLNHLRVAGLVHGNLRRALVYSPGASSIPISPWRS